MRTLLLGISLALVAACTGVTTEPLRLGLVAEPGGELDRAARLAIQQIRAAEGQPVELVVVPAGAETARQLAEVPVHAALLPSDAALASSLAEEDLPILVAGPPPIEGPAHLLPGPGAEGRTLADLLEEDAVGSVALLMTEDRHHQMVADRFLAGFSGTVIARIGLAPDVTASLQELAGAEVEAVVCLCERAAFPRLLQEAFVLGLAGRPWYYGGQAADPRIPAEAFPDTPGRAAGQRGAAVVVPDPTAGEGFEAFARAYQELTGDRPGGQAALTYDGVWLLALAAQTGGLEDVLERISAASRRGRPCSGPACVQMLREEDDIDYRGASGPVDLSEEGTPSPIRVEVWRFTLEGGVEILEVRSYRS